MSGVTTLWAQHTRLTAVEGRRDDLVAKFNEVPELQRGNAAHVLTMVGTSGVGGVSVTEVWTSEAAHEAATHSDAVAAWAEGMDGLIVGQPSSEQFLVVGGNVLDDHRAPG